MPRQDLFPYGWSTFSPKPPIASILSLLISCVAFPCAGITYLRVLLLHLQQQLLEIKLGV